MIVSIEWLNDFVEIKESPNELCDLLSNIGLEAETTQFTNKLPGVIVSKIESVKKHSNADKLKVCMVNDGKNTHQVVCGAPNVSSGQIIAYATIGSILPGNIKIKKVNIRGVESSGMICSENELKISDDHEGIMVLPNNLKLGKEFSSSFGYKFLSIELDITPNRADAFSHFGVARDIACVTGRKLKMLPQKKFTILKKFKIPISSESIDDCPRYIGGILKNVKIGPSPDWIVERLKAAGQRSINNVVDISNYVLLETGHPTHIFDYKKINNKNIIIRRARKNEHIETLDGQKYELNQDHLLITDDNTPLALAGIMGGNNSSVTDDTSEVFVESAYFNPITIRKSSKSLSLSTEASKRFERGANPNICLDAFSRVVFLLNEIAGGKLTSEIIDYYPRQIKELVVTLRPEKINSILGIKIENDKIEKILNGLEISFNFKNNLYECTVPTFRPDISREIDLIEEIARIYGLNSIPSEINIGGFYQYGDPDPEHYLDVLRSSLCGLGFHQLYLNSLGNKTVSELTDIDSIEVLNPLNIEMSNLRTSLLPGLLKACDYNIKNGSNNLRIFEIGQIHHFDQSKKVKFKENKYFAALLNGNQKNKTVHNNEKKEDFYTLKGVIESIFETKFNMNLKFKKKSHSAFEYCHEIIINGKSIGALGKISNNWIETIDLDLTTCFGFEINLDPIEAMITNKKSFKQINTYPTIQRDLNLVMPDNLEVGKIIELISKVGKNLILKAMPVNIFYDPKIFGKDNKSVTFSIVFQHRSKTLEDKDVNSIIDEIINIADQNFNAKLRV